MAVIESDLLGHPSSLRLQVVPVVTTLIGSAVTLLPFVWDVPVLPPCGLLVALGWRLLRPELWAAWIALPLGLADDLIGGAAPGTAMSLWAISFLVIDLVDARPMWRDHWLDWSIAAAAILFCATGSWAIGWFVAGGGTIWPAIMPTTVAVLAFPSMVRLCAAMDRWRLGT
jgi:rod shape-determining protein MreD